MFFTMTAIQNWDIYVVANDPASIAVGMNGGPRLQTRAAFGAPDHPETSNSASTTDGRDSAD